MQALPNGHDDIEAVRLVRDPETLIGKGIGYLLFKDRDSVLLALALHEVRMYLRVYVSLSVCLSFTECDSNCVFNRRSYSCPQFSCSETNFFVFHQMNNQTKINPYFQF